MSLDRRSAALLLGLCSALVVASFAHLLFAGRIPIYRDLLFFTLPLKQFLAERLRAGELPLWNPFVYLGTPFLANPQAGVLYPVSLLLLIPFPLGYTVFLVAHYLIALCGTWLFVRRRGLGPGAAAVGALTFALGGYLVSVMNLTNHAQGAAWAPWVLLAVTHHADQRGLGTFLLLSLALALQLLAGSAEALLMTLAVGLAWAAYSRSPSPAGMLRAGSGVGLAAALAVGLTAAQVLPALEYVRLSPRSAALPLREVSTWSLEPVSLLQLLLPHTGTLLGGADAGFLGPAFEQRLGWIQSIYLGVVPLCLAILGIAYGAERRFWAAVLIAATLLALGSRNPVFVWLYHAQPTLVGKFRYPEKFLFAAHLSAAILAAEGAERLIARRREVQRTSYVAALTLAGAAAAVLVLRWWRPEAYLEALPVVSGKYLPAAEFASLGTDVALKLTRLLGLLAVWLLLQAAYPRVVGVRAFCLLLTALIGVDLGTVNGNLNLSVSWNALQAQPFLVDTRELRMHHERIFHYQTSALDRGEGRLTPIPGLTRWLHSINAAEDLSRAYGELWRTLYTDVGMTQGVAALSGADGMARTSDSLLLRMLLELPRERAIKLLGAYGVRYLIGPDPLDVPWLERVRPTVHSPYYAYRLPDPCPAVVAVTRLRVARPTSEAVRSLTDADFRCREEAVVESVPTGWSEPSRPDGARPQATIVGGLDGVVRVRVRAEQQAFVVLNASSFPGWEATCDGRPVAIHQTNGFVQGVVVPPGDHEVAFAYRPRSLRWGALASALVACAFLACGVKIARRRRRW
jgi:hypothetical protein